MIGKTNKITSHFIQSGVYRIRLKKNNNKLGSFGFDGPKFNPVAKALKIRQSQINLKRNKEDLHWIGFIGRKQ